MLVKELRQGLQSGAFSLTFVALQGGLVLLFAVWIAMASSAKMAGPPGQFFRGLFWFLFVTASVFLIPLRALTALRSEEVGQTFDLLRLTRLSSTQIVAGKWIAVMAQVVLIAVAVMPYVVLQYFLGGYDVVGDLLVIGAVILFAGLVTAAALLASTKTPLTRGIIIAIAAVSILCFFGLTRISYGVFAGIGMLLSGSAVMALFSLATVPVSVVLLEYAVAPIAPRSENHAARKRLLALLLVVLAMLAVAAAWMLSVSTLAASTQKEQLALVWASVLAWVVVTVIAIGEMLGDAVPLCVIHEPFRRFPPLAVLFTPGWATGVVFALVVGAAFIAWAFIAWVTLNIRLGSGLRDATFALVSVAAVLFPIPFTRLGRTVPLRALIYGLVTVMTLLPLAYLSQDEFYRGGLGMRVLEYLSAALPLPNLLVAHSVSSGGFGGFAYRIGPLLTTALVWTPLVPVLGAEITRVLERVAACRTPRDGAPAGRPA
jgi:hypothetical protein